MLSSASKTRSNTPSIASNNSKILFTMLTIKRYFFRICLFAATLLGQYAYSQSPAALPPEYDNTTVVNYIRVWETTAPIQDPASLISRPIEAVKEATQFFDGLGRPIQTVAKKATPLQKDLVTATVYDLLGRETIKYLPFASNVAQAGDVVNDGYFKMNPFQQQAAFYNTQLAGQAGETNINSTTLNWAHSQSILEASPLNRPIKILL